MGGESCAESEMSSYLDDGEIGGYVMPSTKVEKPLALLTQRQIVLWTSDVKILLSWIRRRALSAPFHSQDTGTGLSIN